MARDIDIGHPNIPEVIGGFPEVETFADLPPSEDFIGETFVVATPTGIFFINRKRAGLYRSGGTVWERLGTIPTSGESVGYLPSNPPSGKCLVTNLFVNPDTGRTVVRYDDVPVT